MSSPQVAVLPPLARGEAAPRLAADSRPDRPRVRIAAFAGLAAYGVWRWATLERGAPTWRLLGLLALALALVAVGPLVRRRSLLLAGLLAAVAVLAMFPLAGVPLAWVTHLRVAVTASEIGDGLSALPSVLVPYGGLDESVRLVIALGAGVLLLDAAVILALAPGRLGDLRRAVAALPLLALAVIPSTVVHPKFPFLQGLILFGLLAAFAWGERIERSRLAGAIVVCAAAAILALILAPALERHKPWLDYQALAGRLAGVKTESFDWSQGYGPINWPRDGRTVLEVRAAHRDYWKAEDLDLFAARGWAQASLPGTEDPSGTISARTRKRWTQTIQVTVRSMVTTQVVAAGSAAAPEGASRPIIAGPSPGTWTADGQLGDGDTYAVRTYAPHPSDAELAGAGTSYPTALLPGFLTIYIPGQGISQGQLQQVVFSPFGTSRAAAYGPASPDPGPLLRTSPYARAYALSLRLRRGSATPLAYVQAVEGYLSHGFTYNENPAPSAYPLESFLFDSRAGYCQQFAGAMALLLRMGGVPARVSVGFTGGTYNAATHRWVVSDLDAHAWVEAWFPGYGWVRFDPTPAAAPALGGRSPISGSTGSGSAPKTPRVSGHGHGSAAAASRASHPSGPGSGTGIGAGELAVIAVVVLGGLVLGAFLTRPLAPGESELAELERAFARAGRPLGRETTLLELEHRLAASPDAARYVRALRVSRFGEAAERPSKRSRRALRAQLRMGLGPLGRLRSLWALPPRRARRPGA